MKDPNSPKAEEYIKTIKKNWTISKVEFISNDDIQAHLAPENSFLTVNAVSQSHPVSNGSSVRYNTIFVYLELWVGSDKFFKNIKNKPILNTKDRISIARIELFPDSRVLHDLYLLKKTDYDFGGHIRNWSPGILQNYIQLLMEYLNKGQIQSLYSRISNERELKNLTNEVLYVPDYVLIRLTASLTDENSKHNEKELFEKYRYNYKVISINELNNKILNDTKAFYYLIYVKSNTDKYICVINSLTGEIIYANRSALSYNINADDFKHLRKAIPEK